MNATNTIKIVMADDHPVCRKGFSSMFSHMAGVRLLAEASNGVELLRVTQYYKPDIVLTDIVMPVMDGIQATRLIRKQYPNVAIIAFTNVDDYKTIMSMQRAGVAGYILKDAHETEILQAIRTVHEGLVYYCKETQARIDSFAKSVDLNCCASGDSELFSENETRIIRHICAGLSAKQIAGQLNISLRTVESHRTRIMEKMKVSNTAGLCVYAVKHGLDGAGIIREL